MLKARSVYYPEDKSNSSVPSEQQTKFQCHPLCAKTVIISADEIKAIFMAGYTEGGAVRKCVFCELDDLTL